MKNKLIPLIASVILSVSQSAANAQAIVKKHGNHEISIGFGTGSPVQLMEGVYSGKEGYSAFPIKKFSGLYSFSYRYFFSKKVYAGAAIGFERESGDWQTAKNTGNNMAYTMYGSFKRNVYSIAPEIGVIYSRSRDISVTAYGYLGIGVSYLNEVDAYSVDYYNSRYENGVNPLGTELERSNNRQEWTAQFCPLGFRVGDRLMVFAEVGFGYKGIINGGLVMKLESTKAKTNHD